MLHAGNKKLTSPPTYAYQASTIAHMRMTEPCEQETVQTGLVQCKAISQRLLNTVHIYQLTRVPH